MLLLVVYAGPDAPQQSLVRFDVLQRLLQQLVSLAPYCQLLSESGCFSSVAEIQPTIQKKIDCRLAPFEEVEARRQMFSSSKQRE